MSMLRKLTRVFNRNSQGELRHVTHAIDNTFQMVTEDVALLRYEYVIGTSTGEWLDEFGSWFQVPRETDESDESYRERILFSATRLRNSITAMIQSVERLMPGVEVEVYEPHVHLLKWDMSTWESEDRFIDSDYYRYSTMVIRTSEPATDELKEDIEKIRSGGSMIYFESL